MQGDAMRERIVDAALAAIESAGGTRGLSLRALARDLGCSHANLYHYFDGLPSLLWLCYEKALVLFADHCVQRVESRIRGESTLRAAIAGMAGFALRRRGLYRLLWFDDLGGPPPEWLPPRIASVTDAWRRICGDAFTALGRGEDAAVFGDILFSWAQGRIMALAGGRFVGPAAEAERALLADAETLIGKLSRRGS